MKTNLFRRFPYTSVTLGAASAVLMAAIFANIDLFDLPTFEFMGIEANEVGEIVIVFLLIIPAFFIDRQRLYLTQRQADQLRVLHSAMRTVQDIVGNALMSLYEFRTEAEPSVSPEALALFDSIVAETAAKLKAIGDLKCVIETPMAIGMGIDYQSTPTPANRS